MRWLSETERFKANCILVLSFSWTILYFYLNRTSSYCHFWLPKLFSAHLNGTPCILTCWNQTKANWELETEKCKKGAYFSNALTETALIIQQPWLRTGRVPFCSVSSWIRGSWEVLAWSAVWAESRQVEQLNWRARCMPAKQREKWHKY